MKGNGDNYTNKGMTYSSEDEPFKVNIVFPYGGLSLVGEVHIVKLQRKIKDKNPQELIMTISDIDNMEFGKVKR